jgi:hypothetical protein
MRRWRAGISRWNRNRLIGPVIRNKMTGIGDKQTVAGRSNHQFGGEV